MLWGIPVHEAWWVPRDRVIAVGRAFVMHPSTGLTLRYPNRFSRCDLGVREAARDRRAVAK
jgi:hypothetical protein